MTEFSDRQKEYLDSWFEKLTSAFNEKVTAVSYNLQAEISELKEDFKKVVAGYEEKIETLENQNKQLKKDLTTLERRTRKNNIVIFGLQSCQEEVWEKVLNLFTTTLQVQVIRSEVNNIYHLGKGENRPLLVEFVSYQTKLLVLRNVKKLKDHNISISQDLCYDDRVSNKILVKHMLEAKKKGLQAYIKGHRLVVGKDSYSADQLEDIPYTEIADKGQPKSDSAPPTPNPERRQEVLLKELIGEAQEQQERKKSKAKANKMKGSTVHTRSNSVASNKE